MTPPDDTAAIIAEADGADMVWVESIANPLMVVADVPAIAAGARERGAISVVDATFATPLRQRPLGLGADIVMHSATKLIGGHSDLLLGAAVCRDDAHADFLVAHRHDHGAIPGGFEAFLALRGLRTLAVRLDRAEASAAELARRLASHPNITKVYYPGLPGDSQHERASRVLSKGSGSMMSFEVAGSRRTDRGSALALAAAHSRDQPRRRGVPDRAPRPIRWRRGRRRPDPVSHVGRHRERRGSVGGPRRCAAGRARLIGFLCPRFSTSRARPVSGGDADDADAQALERPFQNSFREGSPHQAREAVRSPRETREALTPSPRHGRPDWAEPLARPIHVRRGPTP